MAAAIAARPAPPLPPLWRAGGSGRAGGSAGAVRGDGGWTCPKQCVGCGGIRAARVSAGLCQGHLASPSPAGGRKAAVWLCVGTGMCAGRQSKLVWGHWDVEKKFNIASFCPAS